MRAKNSEETEFRDVRLHTTSDIATLLFDARSVSAGKGKRTYTKPIDSVENAAIDSIRAGCPDVYSVPSSFSRLVRCGAGGKAIDSPGACQ